MIKHRILDISAFVTNAIAFSVNFVFFLPIGIEQIKTGWGFPTHYEMFTLFFWMMQALTLPLVFFCIVYGILALLRKKKGKLVFVNFVMTALTILLMVFSVVFAFN